MCHCNVLGQILLKYIVRYRRINTCSMKTYVLLHFEHKNDVTVIIKLLYLWSYEPQASGSVKFDNYCDVIFMFKM